MSWFRIYSNGVQAFARWRSRSWFGFGESLIWRFSLVGWTVVVACAVGALAIIVWLAMSAT